MWVNKIKEKQFSEALHIIGAFNESHFRELQEVAYNEEDLIYYDFLLFLIDQDENSLTLNYWASELLSTALNIFPDSYSNALKHARRACEINPNDESLLEHLLLFYEIPDKLLSKLEAQNIAQKLLAINPNNKAARLVLSGNLSN